MRHLFSGGKALREALDRLRRSRKQSLGGAYVAFSVISSSYHLLYFKNLPPPKKVEGDFVDQVKDSGIRKGVTHRQARRKRGVGKAYRGRYRRADLCVVTLAHIRSNKNLMKIETRSELTARQGSRCTAELMMRHKK